MLMLLMAQTTEGTGKEDREALDRLLIEIAAGSRRLWQSCTTVPVRRYMVSLCPM